MDYDVRAMNEEMYRQEMDAEDFEYRVASLMDYEYNPCNPDNIQEAIQQASVDQLKNLQAHMEVKDWEAVGRAVWCISFDYWERIARKWA